MGNTAISATADAREDVFDDIRVDVPKVKEGGFIPLNSLTISEVATLLDNSCLSEFKVQFRKKLINGKRLISLIKAYAAGFSMDINEKFYFIFSKMRMKYVLSVPKVMCRNTASRYQMKSPATSFMKEFLHQLINAGKSKEEIARAGITFEDIKHYAPDIPVSRLIKTGYKYWEFVSVGYQLEKSKLRQQGFSPIDLMNNGFSIMQLLRDCRYSLEELKSVGISHQELIKGGVNKANGFLLEDLVRLNMTPQELKMAGFSPKDLQSVGIPLKTIASLSYTVEDYKRDGIDAQKLYQSNVSVKKALKIGFPLLELSEGYGVQRLYEAGISIEQMLSSGISKSIISKELQHNPKVLDELLRNGYSYSELIRQDANNYSITELVRYGKTSAELIACGINGPNGFSAKEFKRNGATIHDMIEGKWSVADILSAGYSVDDLRRGGYTDSSIISTLLREGVSLRDIHEKFGFSFTTMMKESNGQITWQKLRDAGYSADAMITADVNKSNGWTVVDMVNKCNSSAENLRKAGFDNKEIIQHFNKSNGYSIGYLQRLGLSDQEIELAGYSMSQKDKDRRAKAAAVREKRNAMLSSVTETPFQLRKPPSGLPFRTEDITLDLVIVMDCTASMGSWMAQSKQQLVNIIHGLKDECGFEKVRIAYIGYREYNDPGRCVYHPFVTFDKCSEVINFMQKQNPSGGGDRPEDVLAGFECALNKLEWNSHLRFSLLVADAPAHGYDDAHDDFPSGKCPDQTVDLPTILTRLKDQKHMDLLFCKGDPCTKKKWRT